MEAPTIICNNCGVAFEESMRFCSECGAQVFVSRGASAVPPSGEAEQGEPRTAAASSYAPSPATTAAPFAYSGLEAEKARKPSDSARIIALAVAAAFLLLLAGAGITLLIFKSKDNPDARASGPATITKGPSASSSASPSVGSTPPNSAAAPTSQTWEADVTATLAGWVSALEAHDLDTHMSYFAETLDTYYSHRHVGAARVRADLERAFSRYSTLSVRLSGIRVTFDRDNESASVTLDKTWTFANGPDTASEKTWSGSVRQMLWLRQSDGRWRITGLKDI
jgi:ketosteroid isomerase-like protein